MKHLSKLVICVVVFSLVSTNANAAKKWLFKAAKVESVEIWEGYLVLRIEGTPELTVNCDPTKYAGAVRLYTADAWYKSHFMAIALAAQSTGKLVDVWMEDTTSCNQDASMQHYNTDFYLNASSNPGMGLPIYGLRIREN